MKDQFDAIIIGSGAGGAPIANILTRAGKSVLILEKGPLFRPQYQAPNSRSDFKRDELISDGPEKRVLVWQGSVGDRRSYADLTRKRELGAARIRRWPNSRIADDRCRRGFPPVVDPPFT